MGEPLCLWGNVDEWKRIGHLLRCDPQYCMYILAHLQAPAEQKIMQVEVYVTISLVASFFSSFIIREKALLSHKKGNPCTRTTRITLGPLLDPYSHFHWPSLNSYLRAKRSARTRM